MRRTRIRSLQGGQACRRAGRDKSKQAGRQAGKHTGKTTSHQAKARLVLQERIHHLHDATSVSWWGLNSTRRTAYVWPSSVAIGCSGIRTSQTCNKDKGGHQAGSKTRAGRQCSLSWPRHRSLLCLFICIIARQQPGGQRSAQTRSAMQQCLPHGMLHEKHDTHT